MKSRKSRRGVLAAARHPSRSAGDAAAAACHALPAASAVAMATFGHRAAENGLRVETFQDRRRLKFWRKSDEGGFVNMTDFVPIL